MSMFQGRKLVITSKHGKAASIGPVLEKALGVEIVVNEAVDTDQLGTFTGEIERTMTPLEAAKTKCLQGMDQSGIDIGVANEGSFGPHPVLFFVPCNEEWLVLIDQKNQLEIVVRDLVTDTNFDGQEIDSKESLWDFAEKAKFPSHALILRKNKNTSEDIAKGLDSKEELERVFEELLEKHGKAYIETDMRAHVNPTRMAFIGRLSEKLAERCLSACPSCQTPGFGRTSTIKGLPCGFCGTPTRSILSYLHTCQKCGHTEEEAYPNGKEKEDPMYCDYCNP